MECQNCKNFYYMPKLARKQQSPQGQGRIVYVAAAWEKDVFYQRCTYGRLRKIFGHS